MKLCLVSQEYPPETARGGIGTQTWNKARALVRLGHDVHVLTASATAAPSLRTTDEQGVTVHRLQPPGFDHVVYEPATYWLGYAWAVLHHLRGLMRDGPFDLIDFAEYGGEGFAFLLDRTPWSWVPVVVQLHGPLAMFAERMGWPDKTGDFCRIGSMMEEWCIRHADALMACSANIADFTALHYGVPRDAIDVVHCGVDANAFHPAPVGGGPPTVLFVGNIAPNKGVDRVLEAVLALRMKYPDLRLQLLGKGDDDMAHDLRRQAQVASAEQAVEFVGFVERERLPDYYRRATVFCSPAHHEPGVANVYLEAMACGCPVIAGNTGGAPEAVRDHETGLIVPPLDVGALTRALDLVLGDPALRQRLGAAARRLVEERFGMDHYIERVLATYARGIENARRTHDRQAREKGGAP